MSIIRLYNQTLSPDLWDRFMNLDQSVRLELLKVSHDFYKKSKLPAPIKDIYLMGSSANFNWNSESDIDVHIIVDFNLMKMPIETASKIVKTISSQWNSDHNIQIKGHKVEVNIQDFKEQKPYVTGIYSLLTNKWVRKPQYKPISIDRVEIQNKYTQLKDFINSSINSMDIEKMKSAKEFLDDYRQHGLDTMGELSIENIVYKILRTKGVIKKLKDNINKSYDKNFSITENSNEDMFARGYCAEYAIALNEKTGLPIVSFDEIIDHGDGDLETQSIHYACKKGNKFIDVRGERSKEDIMSNLIGSDFQPAKNVDIRILPSPEYLENETEINPEALKIARQIVKLKL